MKKHGLLTLFFTIGFLLTSCTYDEYFHHVIENRSAARTVSFTFNNEPIELSPGESAIRSINSWEGGREVPQDITFIGHEKSMRMIVNWVTYTFIDVPQSTLSVINSLPISVTLSTAYMVGGSVSIPETGTGTAVMYTNNPTFHVTPAGYPIILDMEFIGSTVYVVIR